MTSPSGGGSGKRAQLSTCKKGPTGNETWRIWFFAGKEYKENKIHRVVKGKRSQKRDRMQKRREGERGKSSECGPPFTQSAWKNARCSKNFDRKKALCPKAYSFKRENGSKSKAEAKRKKSRMVGGRKGKELVGPASSSQSNGVRPDLPEERIKAKKCTPENRWTNDRDAVDWVPKDEGITDAATLKKERDSQSKKPFNLKQTGHFDPSGKGKRATDSRLRQKRGRVHKGASQREALKEANSKSERISLTKKQL